MKKNTLDGINTILDIAVEKKVMLETWKIETTPNEAQKKTGGEMSKSLSDI